MNSSREQCRKAHCEEGKGTRPDHNAIVQWCRIHRHGHSPLLLFCGTDDFMTKVENHNRPCSHKESYLILFSSSLLSSLFSSSTLSLSISPPLSSLPLDYHLLSSPLLPSPPLPSPPLFDHSPPLISPSTLLCHLLSSHVLLSSPPVLPSSPLFLFLSPLLFFSPSSPLLACPLLPSPLLYAINR